MKGLCLGRNDFCGPCCSSFLQALSCSGIRIKKECCGENLAEVWTSHHCLVQRSKDKMLCSADQGELQLWSPVERERDQQGENELDHRIKTVGKCPAISFRL